MKRAGFTMIELIFVIVILGILAAVALPKFVGVASQAQVGKVSAYVGTLNRTVGPALWSMSISNRDLGSIRQNGAASGTNYVTEAAAQIEVPTGVGDTAALDLTALNVYACSVYTPLPVGQNQWTDADIMGWGVASTVTVDGTLYNIVCMDGSGTESPRFGLVNTALGTVVTR